MRYIRMTIALRATMARDIRPGARPPAAMSQIDARRRHGVGRWAAQQQDQQGGCGQDPGDDPEAVDIGEDEGLPLDEVAGGGEALARFEPHIVRALGEDVGKLRGDAIHHVRAYAQMLPDIVRIGLLAYPDEGLDEGSPELDA